MSWGVWSARIRFTFARHPWAYWLLAGTLAVMAAVQVHAASARADAARAAWGSARIVWVLTADADTGARVRAESRALPAAVVPPGALDHDPGAAVATHPIAAGAVLTPLDVADPTDVADPALVLALPADATPALGPTEPVQLIGVSGVRCDGTVTAAGPDLVEVAVPPDCAASLRADVLAGDVLVARWAGTAGSASP